ncbi:ubiquitin [Pseudohyphozyma bogoriensis]|nr:ubiquitin [Pseudohyphozyma bogoriensis]
MQIFVKTIGGTTRTLELAPSSSIASLRELLEAKDADSVDSRILFGGKQLEGGTLEEYGVGREATLHLVGSLAGGFGAGNIPSYSFLEGKAFRFASF